MSKYYSLVTNNYYFILKYSKLKLKQTKPHYSYLGTLIQINYFEFKAVLKPLNYF